jgi:hypothetical protein
MQRQCAWFGCNVVAAATYTFDSTTCTVWLDTPFDGSARAGDLCQRHARSLTPPRGWRIEDRRDDAPAQPQFSLDEHERDVPEEPRVDSDAEDELRTMLDVHSPLLERAFRSSGAF